MLAPCNIISLPVSIRCKIYSTIVVIKCDNTSVTSSWYSTLKQNKQQEKQSILVSMNIVLSSINVMHTATLLITLNDYQTKTILLPDIVFCFKENKKVILYLKKLKNCKLSNLTESYYKRRVNRKQIIKRGQKEMNQVHDLYLQPLSTCLLYTSRCV